MTSFDQLIGTRDVPVLERAPRISPGWVLVEWLRMLAATGAQVVLTVAVLLGLLATVPVLFGQISTTVMSDSMAPGLQAGDVVILKPVKSNHVKIGQVVLVDDPDHHGRLRLHRLLDVQHGDLVLKGDANRTPDSDFISAQNLHGVGWLRVPLIGLPVLWMRDQTYLPLGLAALALMLLAWLAASAGGEDGPVDGPPLGRRALRRAISEVLRLLRRLRRSKAGSKAAGAVASVVLLAALLVAAPLTLPGAAAAFNATTTSPNNSLATGTFDCPTRPMSASALVLYYSYMPASGTAEPDLSNGSMPGTLGPGATRVSGNCSGNASPYVRVDATANGYVAANVAEPPRNSNFGISLWYNTSVNSGVLASFGTTNDGAPSAAGDRQIYFDSTGKLAYVMGRPGKPNSGCTITTAPSTGAWHLVTLSFTGGNYFVLTVDNTATTCNGYVNNISTLTQGYWRFGGDTPLDAGAANNYSGALDETAVFNGGIQSSSVTALWNAGH
jgi:signal peptidase I